MASSALGIEVSANAAAAARAASAYSPIPQRAPDKRIGTIIEAAIRPKNKARVSVGYCSSSGSTTPAAAKIAITIPITSGIRSAQDIALNLAPASASLGFEKPNSSKKPRTASEAEFMILV